MKAVVTIFDHKTSKKEYAIREEQVSFEEFVNSIVMNIKSTKYYILHYALRGANRFEIKYRDKRFHQSDITIQGFWYDGPGYVECKRLDSVV